MPSAVQEHIDQTIVIDSHEHLNKEDQWINEGPADVLSDLFSNYVPADFVSAGADEETLAALSSVDQGDIATRWRKIEPVWQSVQFTGYGQAVGLIAKEVYGIDELTAEAIAAAQPTLEKLRQPGGRLQLLRDVAKIDHVQVDDFTSETLPDPSGSDFFLYDLSLMDLCNGNIDPQKLQQLSGVNVNDLATLDQAMQAIFERFGPMSIAAKSQHAYNRTLRWEERSDGDAQGALQEILSSSQNADPCAKLCIGDWAWARGTELCIEYNLPFKIHTGYYAGNASMVVDRIAAGNLCPLLLKYPDARFVLMHSAYPYSDEVIALVKHFRNCWADMCWAWSINPLASGDFVRRFIHAAPSNKLFVYGGDTFWPTSAVGYTLQMRQWLGRTLEAEVADGLLTEKQAIDLASKFMRGNQLACFDVQGTRAAIAAHTTPVS